MERMRLGQLVYVLPHHYRDTASIFNDTVGKIIAIDVPRTANSWVRLQFGEDLFNADVWMEHRHLRAATEEEIKLCTIS
jgi:hypothetical protein